MNQETRDNLIGTLLFFSTEYDLHLHRLKEEKKEYSKLIKSQTEGKVLTKSQKIELGITPSARNMTLTLRDDFRKTSIKNLNFKGGHGGIQRKLFNSLVRDLASHLKNFDGKIDWKTVLQILINPPEIFHPVFPHRKIIRDEYLTPFLKRKYDEMNGCISKKKFSLLEKHIANDYISFDSFCLHTDAFSTIVKSLQKSIP